MALCDMVSIFTVYSSCMQLPPSRRALHIARICHEWKLQEHLHASAGQESDLMNGIAWRVGLWSKWMGLELTVQRWAFGVLGGKNIKAHHSLGNWNCWLKIIKNENKLFVGFLIYNHAPVTISPSRHKSFFSTNESFHLNQQFLKHK